MYTSGVDDAMRQVIVTEHYPSGSLEVYGPFVARVDAVQWVADSLFHAGVTVRITEMTSPDDRVVPVPVSRG